MEQDRPGRARVQAGDAAVAARVKARDADKVRDADKAARVAVRAAEAARGKAAVDPARARVAARAVRARARLRDNPPLSRMRNAQARPDPNVVNCDYT